MEISSKNIKLPSYVAMIIAFLTFGTIFSVLYFIGDSNNKITTFYAGLAASFFVAAVQFFVQIYEYLKLRKYEKMGIINMLTNRADRDYYGKLIENSQQEILVMGVTASRFFDDFANANEGNMQLIEAASRGVSIKILLPKIKHLGEKDSANLRELTLKLIKNDHLSQKCQVKYFDHTAAHSLVLVDKTCIVGPIFKDVSSKNTPAIVLTKDSVVAKPYIDNFNKEWEISDETYE